MKNIIMCFVLLFFMGDVCNAQAQTKNPSNHGVVLKCLSPLDVLRGAGCYVIDTGGRTVQGVGTIITAPFKAKWCFPPPRRYFYRLPQWRWIPGELTPLPYPKPPCSPPQFKRDFIPSHPEPIRGNFYYPLYYPKKGLVALS